MGMSRDRTGLVVHVCSCRSTGDDGAVVIEVTWASERVEVAGLRSISWR